MEPQGENTEIPDKDFTFLSHEEHSVPRLGFELLQSYKCEILIFFPGTSGSSCFTSAVSRRGSVILQKDANGTDEAGPGLI